MGTDTQADPDWSRRDRVLPGAGFIEAIWLDGYEHQSIWGYDTGTSSFFAQVWPNGSTSEAPELSLTPPDQQMSRPHMIVPQLVDYTGEDPLPVVRAMGLAAPSAALVDVDELAARLEQCGRRPTTEYTNGEIAALKWILGDGSRSPSSGSVDGGDGDRPAPDIVDAEATYATGMVYLTRGQYVAGIEGALVPSFHPATSASGDVSG